MRCIYGKNIIKSGSGWFSVYKLSEIKSAANKVAKKSGELVELSKIKLNIVSTKSSIDEQFKILGELVYKSQNDDSANISEKIEDVIAKIDRLYEKLAELDEMSAQVSNKVVCPNCKKVNSADAEFCSRCGFDLSDEA